MLDRLQLVQLKFTGSARLQACRAGWPILCKSQGPCLDASSRKQARHDDATDASALLALLLSVKDSALTQASCQGGCFL